MKKLIFALVFLLLVPAVLATTISMVTTVQDVSIAGNSRTSNITLQNKGDETSFSVLLQFILPQGFATNETAVGDLSANSIFNSNFTIYSIQPSLKGSYPGILIVNYKDANEYPFSALTPFTITNQQRTSAAVVAQIGDLELAGNQEKTLTVDLKNLDDKDRSLNIQLYLPKELKSTETHKYVTVPAKDERKVDFTVSNLAALTGSSYTVLASVEYDDGLHYSTVARGNVKIVQESGFSNTYLMALLAVLVVIFIYYEVRKRQKRAKK